MTTLLVLAVLALAVAWTRATRRLDSLERQVRELSLREPSLQGLAEVPAPVAPLVSEPRPLRAAAKVVNAPAPPPLVIPPPPTPSPKPPEPAPERRTAGALFEQLVGGRLPIWVGGAALAIAGYFLVRLAIESGLLTPSIRVLLATLFGFALLAAAEGAVRWRVLAADERIGQALSGAGIATLYAAVYLAGAHYGLIGPILAFVLLAAITLAALALSLRRGAPVALMALVGGFATPLLAGANGGAVLPLLAYLGLLSAGLFWLAATRGWLWLSLSAAAGALVWSGLLIATDSDGDALAAGAFAGVLAIAASFACAASGGRSTTWLRAVPLVAGTAELAALVATSGFGGGAWGLYLLLSAATIFLAWRDAALTPAVAAALMLAAAALAGTAMGPDSTLVLAAAAGMALLFGGAGHLLGRRTGDGRWWAAIGAAGLLAPYALLWAEREGLLPEAGWAALALVAGLAPAHLAWRARGEARGQPPFDVTLQIAAGAAATLLAAALAVVAPALLLPASVLGAAVALAVAGRRIGDGGLMRLSLAGVGIAAICWLGLEDPARAFLRLAATLPPVAAPLAIEALLAPALLLAAVGWANGAARARDALLLAAAALFAAGIAALVAPGWRSLVMAAATLVAGELTARRIGPARLVPIAGLGALLWVAAIAGGVGIALVLSAGGAHLLLPDLPGPTNALRAALLPGLLVAAAGWRVDGPSTRRLLLAGGGVAVAAGLYVLWKQVFAIADEPGFVAHGFLERALLTQALFAGGWAAARARWARIGGALFAVAVARLLWLDLIVCDPAWTAQAVGPLPIFNLLVLHFAAAVLWIEQRWRAAPPGRARAALLAALVLAAAGGTALAVRQAFHGSILAGGAVSRPEFYGYSAAGVLLAVALFARGAWVKDGPLRIAGLGLLTAMVLKVFLVDAAALEGLLRIASFLGLGLTLIAIGWAYGRLFGRPAAPSPSPPG